MVKKGLTFPKSNKFAYFLITVTLFIYVLIVAKDFLYPITFGILLAYLLYPIANYLEKKKIPRILAILISIVSATIVVSIIAAIAIKRIDLFTDNLPQFRKKAIDSIRLFEEQLKYSFGFSDKFINKLINPNMIIDIFNVENIFSATTGTVSKYLCNLFTFFFFFITEQKSPISYCKFGVAKTGRP